MSKKVRERLSHKEKTVERRDKMLEHDFSAERATLEEVFDQSTLMVVFSFLSSGMLDEVNGVVSAGKEARVYWGTNKEGVDLAVKIYLTSSAEFRKGMLKYIEGDYRFKGVKHDTRSLVSSWAQKEFRNLQQALNAKVRVPKPIGVRKNVLLMEFIGKDGTSAPCMKEQPPENPEKVYKLLLTYVSRLYQKADLVHGDLSEYNVMMWKNRPVLFDMSQSVPRSHPLATSLLERDVANLNKFFSRLGVKVLTNEETCRLVTD
ncbi:TPA: serine protein kinase RIO [Candidatus Bathyarchaeota archaeon]|nr:serine protein kinase RIO [Candidatus Bathyarchaeota archaeon]HIJ09094.1 serine protein kinase RIO [Candidatus Bathyarchaeota archaeon]